MVLKRQAYDSSDYSTAVEYLQAAAEQDYPGAIHLLGICYWDGCGVSENQGKAFKLFQRAAEMGYSEAMIDLASCYAIGIEGILPRDYRKAIQWCRKAADAGNPDAYCDLGLWYEAVGDIGQAVKYLRKAAEESGDSFAADHLRRVYG